MRIRGRQLIWLATVAAAIYVLPVCVRAGSPSSTKASSGSSSIRFSSPGQFAYDQALLPIFRAVDESARQPLAMPAQHQVAQSLRPLKQIILLGGDRLSAEILRWEETDVELRMQTGYRVVIPRKAVVEVRTPRGERETFYESFDGAAANVLPPAEVVRPPMIDPAWIEVADADESRQALRIGKAQQPLGYLFPQPLQDCRIQFWFRIGDANRAIPEREATKSDSTVSIEFVSREPLIVQATATYASVSTSDAEDRSVTRQKLVLDEGWHCLTALLLRDRTVVVIDQGLLWSANRGLGPLGEIRFSGQGSSWIDDLQCSQFETEANVRPLRPTTEDDCVSLNGGEELFGRVSQVTTTGVTLTNSAGARQVGWSQVLGFALRQTDQMATCPISPIGLAAAVELQSSFDRPNPLSDHLTVIVVHIDHRFIIVAHPWLGRFAIPWTRIARISPQFYGQAMTLDGRRRHLGDAIRDDFPRQLPDATEWTVKFELPAQPRVSDWQLWLSLDVIDLEPAGLQTPPGSPFLRELRKGQLLTKISINNQPAGDLNRWIQYRATPDRPERIRCLLPKELRVGENVIRLHQVPLKGSGSRFDNCELSNLRLEVVEPIR